MDAPAATDGDATGVATGQPSGPVSSRGTLDAAWVAHGEKARYLVVGAYNTAVGYAAFVAAIVFISPPLEAASGISHKAAALAIQWALWVIAVVHSTVTMKYWVFQSRGHLGTEIAKSYLVYLPAQGVSSVILWFFMAVLGLSAAAGQAVAVVTGVIITFLGHKHFTFKGDSA